jgi:hypothetical protein
MDIARASITEQVAAFEQLVLRNPITTSILSRLDELGLPDCWLAAGALFQTVWNCLTDRDPCDGIRDYDLLYFDATDLSWPAEDDAIRRAAALFADLDVPIEVRNEARVHLWYEGKFGVPCPPYVSTRHAIDTFAATTCSVGVRPSNGSLEIYAPYGFGDLFGLVVRPNPVLAPRWRYETKAQRWKAEWPELTVLAWPAAVEQPVAAQAVTGQAVDGGL